nr:TonB-dependent receptor [uncultured Undibacterium sp.]
MINKYKQTAFVRRSAIALAIGMCFATAAMAQSSDGSIFGRATANAKITITSLDNGSNRLIDANPDGTFRIAKVSPGKYKILSGGVAQEIEVVIGSGTEVSLLPSTSVVVTGSRTRQTIDVSSVESNTVFTQAEIQSMPIPRSATAVAMLAPGTVQGDSGLANLPSFGGASIAENAYFINGMDVTNVRTLLSFANLPFDAIEQQQIKTGGYGAEYGRSLGGVIGLTSKRGSNTWKGGVGVIYSPDSFSAKPTDIRSKETPSTWYLFSRGNSSSTTEVNANLGGPIIKDKLFVWGMVTSTNSFSDSFGRTSSSASESGRPNGMLKLDFVPNGDHRFELTAITNHSKSHSFSWIPRPYPQEYALVHFGDPLISSNKNLANIFIGKYTGYLTDDLSVSFLTGATNAYTGLTKGASATRTYEPNAPCPYVTATDITNKVTYPGCYVLPAVAARDAVEENFDKRRSNRLDLEYTIGNHRITAGVDLQDWKSGIAGSRNNSAGKTYAYLVSKTGEVNLVKNAVAPGGEYVRTSLGYSTSGVYQVVNDAKYIEDKWQAMRNLVLYGGLRWESFVNKNAAGTPFIEKKNLLAPRLGFAWNVNGDATTKLYGNAGRYYIPVAANTNYRGTQISYSETEFATFTSKDPKNGVPGGLVPIGNKVTSGLPTYPNPGSIVDPNLKPMNQDEFILGIQHAVAKNLSGGLKYTNRRLNSGMDDYCSEGPIVKHLRANGYPNFKSANLPECVLLNPGSDLTLKLDVNGDGKLVQTTIPSSVIGLPKYTRLYDALEFSLDRPFDGVWAVGGSYVWSKSRGTGEGYVQSNLNQADAGITQDFDYSALADGSDGFLPNDRRHQVKFYGHFKLNDTWTFGFNSFVTSGRPTSCIGFVPKTSSDFYDSTGKIDRGAGHYNSPSSYYCLNDQGVSVLSNRGTGPRMPWTKQLDLSANYNQKIGPGTLTVQFSLVNLFDTRTTTEWNEVRDFSRTESTRIAKNYQLPTSRQTPRYLRLSARYNF